MRALSEDIQKLIPLTPAVFHILLALAPGAMHGYAIMLETSTLSEGNFRMGPATLYSTIQRLVALRLIDETTGDSEEDARRRYYQLTDIGRQLLDVEVQRMNAAVRKANARLVKRPAEN